MSATTRLWQKRFSSFGGILKGIVGFFFGCIKMIFINAFTKHPVFKIFAIPVAILIFINVGVKVGFIQVKETETVATVEKPKSTVDYINDLNDDAWRKAKRSHELVPAETIVRLNTLFDDVQSNCFKSYLTEVKKIGGTVKAGEMHSAVRKCVLRLDDELKDRAEKTERLKQWDTVNKILKD